MPGFILPRHGTDGDGASALAGHGARRLSLSAGRLGPKGDLVATVIDPLGEETQLLAETDGRLFARHSQPYAWPGRVIGKIAGEIPLKGREGNLLSD